MNAMINGRLVPAASAEPDVEAEADRELRAASICGKCSQPREGLVPEGQTLREAGLCRCGIVAEGQREMFA